MAANYWASTQRSHWLFSKGELEETRQKLEDNERNIVQQFPLADRRLVSLFIHQQITKLGKRMPTRQQALATAQIYIKRFYTKVELRRTNPYLLLTTAFYLACKMEECPQHIRLVVGEARNLWTESTTLDVAKLGECEFSLISELSSQLIIHHPYRFLNDFKASLGMTPDETALAWSVINDHYLTDLPLLHPPHVIAVMAIFIAMIFKPGAIPTNPNNNKNNNAATAAVSGSLQGGSAGTAAAISNAMAGLGGGGGGDGNTSSISSSTSANDSSSANAAGSGPVPIPMKVQKLISWLAESEIDIEAVIEATQEMISLYEVWEQYSEKAVKEQFSRFIKGRGWRSK